MEPAELGSPRDDAEVTTSVWTTRGPDAWPSPPLRMSYTSLRDIETCPLRWALRRGAYSGIWTGKGYPSAPAGAAIAGQIVHVAIERIVRAVAASASAQGTDDQDVSGSPMLAVVEGLRRLGGISAVLQEVTEEIVAAWEQNPRVRPRAHELTNELRRVIPSLRPRVQHFLNRTDLSRVRAPRPLSQTAPAREADETSARPLPSGVYAEVPLVDEDLGWFGKADLLRVPAEDSVDEGEIVDFKTGAPKPDHALQLRSYALLWARDRRLNPSSRRVRRLTVLYETGPVNVAVPITDQELGEVERDLRSRTTQVRAALECHPPEAHPAREACEWCDVRHLCPAYWAPQTRELIAASESTALPFIDAAVRIISKQGAWSWIGIVDAVGALSTGLSVGDRVLVRARPYDAHFTSLLTFDETFRIVSAQLVAASDESGGLPVLSLTRATEAFMVSEDG